MAIGIRILGTRGADTAVLVTINTGQQISRLLMDCGENTVARLSFSESAEIDHVLFSHFHMDHVSGFDTFFRRHYDRCDRVNYIWGPPGTIEIMGHRFRSFVWNLIGDRKATWQCQDIDLNEVKAAHFEMSDAFTIAHDEPSDATPEHLFDGPGFHVEAITLHHGIPSIGYIVREASRWNVNATKLGSLGLKPGPWLKTLLSDQITIIDGVQHDSDKLRSELLVQSTGDSMAFLTDFIAEGDEQARIADKIAGVGTLICECQYAAADIEHARRNAHMTTSWVGELAKLANPQRLLLTHFSERYRPSEWDAMVEEVRQIFPRTEVAG